MPGTRTERIVAFLLFAVTVAIVALAVGEARRDHSTAQTATATVAEVLSTATTPTTTTPTTTARPPTPQPKPRPTPTSTALNLTATGGESWFEVRDGAADGRVLYLGLLPQGQSVNVKAKVLWLRFGAAANLTAQLNGKPLALPAGTYSAVVSSTGLQQVPG